MLSRHRGSFDDPQRPALSSSTAISSGHKSSNSIGKEASNERGSVRLGSSPVGIAGSFFASITRRGRTNSKKKKKKNNSKGEQDNDDREEREETLFFEEEEDIRKIGSAINSSQTTDKKDKKDGSGINSDKKDKKDKKEGSGINLSFEKKKEGPLKNSGSGSKSLLASMMSSSAPTAESPLSMESEVAMRLLNDSGSFDDMLMSTDSPLVKRRGSLLSLTPEGASGHSCRYRGGLLLIGTSSIGKYSVLNALCSFSLQTLGGGKEKSIRMAPVSKHTDQHPLSTATTSPTLNNSNNHTNINSNNSNNSNGSTINQKTLTGVFKKKELYVDFLASLRQVSNDGSDASPPISPRAPVPESDGCLRVRDFSLHASSLKALTQETVYFRAFDFQSQMASYLFPFFLSAKTVLLVIFGLFDDGELADLPTWLKYIKSVLTDEGPRVVLVGTYTEDKSAREKRLMQIAPSLNALGDTYRDIIESFVALNVKGKSGLKKLRAILYKLGLQLFKPVARPQRYDEVLSKVLTEKDKKIPAVSRSSFEQICESLSPPIDTKDLNEVTRVLHKEGILYHMDATTSIKNLSPKSAKLLANWVVYDKRWLAEAYYLLLNQYPKYTTDEESALPVLQRRKRDGMLTITDLRAIWKPEDGYPGRIHKMLVTLFEAFNLVFLIRPVKQKVYLLDETDKNSPSPPEKKREEKLEKFLAKHPGFQRADKKMRVKTVYRNLGSFERELDAQENLLEQKEKEKSPKSRSPARKARTVSLCPPMVEEAAAKYKGGRRNGPHMVSGGMEDAKILIPNMLPVCASPEDLAKAGWKPRVQAEDEGIVPKSPRRASLAIGRSRIGETTKRSYSYTNLPIGLFSRLLIRLLDVVQVPFYWQNGLVCQKDDEHALVQVVKEKDLLEISMYHHNALQVQSALWRLLESNVENVSSYWFDMNPTIKVFCTHCLHSSSSLQRNSPYVFSIDAIESAMTSGQSYVECLHLENLMPVQVFISHLLPDAALSSLQSYEIELNKFTEIEVIAKGTHTIVKKAQYGDKPVALKEFIVPAGTEPEEMRRILKEFRHEALLMSGFDNHPNVVKLLGICKQPLALVMEFIDGGTLFEFLHRPDPLPWVTRVNIALHIAKGADFLHSASPPIIHRDLKSVNILMQSTPYGYVAKVNDFGLSAVFSLRIGGRDVDNPLWLAPEVMRGEEYSEKSDVYSYGICLWEIASRSKPFEEFNISFLSALEEKIIAGLRPTLPPTLPLSHTSFDELKEDACPQEFAQIIQDCWQPTPHLRPSLLSVIRRLNALLQAKKWDIY